MTRDTAAIENEALDWIIRQRDPGFADWEAFADWLGTSPDHAAHYQAMADADREVPAMMPAPVRPPLRAPAPVRVPMRRRAWLGGALAASLVALTTYGVLDTRTDPYAVETAAGRPRLLALADGTRIDLNGGTRLVLDRNHPRDIVLEHGEAVFTVAHDAARPFAVRVGDSTLVDVGTVFNVARRAGSTEVGVAQGEVIFNPKRENVRLSAGRTLRSVDKDTKLVIGEIEPGVIGAWRTGRLVYDGTPLALVAEDLTRNLGYEIAVAPEVAGRPFRGVISFGADRDAVMARLGPLLGVKVRRVDGGWRLDSQDG